MGGRMPPAGGVGLLLMVLGGVLVVYLVRSEHGWQPLPSVLIGLSMIAFGFSMLHSAHRRR